MSFLRLFFNDPATTEIYTLSLHDALPISRPDCCPRSRRLTRADLGARWHTDRARCFRRCHRSPQRASKRRLRSEEHTSELQSHSDLVCRLLLEKKKRRAVLMSHAYRYFPC